jgi:Ni,Fe-hydrogenase III large subunit
VIRTIALELERIANHVGDLGALSGDVAFLPPANYCGRMRGDFLNMSLWICGNRFGKGLVRPGGVRFPMTDEDRKVLTGRIAEIQPQVSPHHRSAVFHLQRALPFRGLRRCQYGGRRPFGLVGPAGRACGLPTTRGEISPRSITRIWTFLSMPKPPAMSMPGPGCGPTKCCNPLR